MGFDGRTSIGKAIGDIICRTEIVFGKEGIESFGTKERIIRTNTDKAVDTENFGSTDKAVEYIVLVATKTEDTRLTGGFGKHVVLRAIGGGKYNTFVRTSLFDIGYQNVDDALFAIEGEQNLVVQPGRTGACLNDYSIFHNFIRLKASI